MTDVLVKPAFQSTFQDSGDPTKFGPSAWNAARVFSDGVSGDLLVRDTGSATGASWTPFALYAGSVNPEGNVTGAVGDLYVRSNGQIFSKKTGAGNTGWAQLVDAVSPPTIAGPLIVSGGAVRVDNGQGLEFGSAADTAIYGSGATDSFSFYAGGSERLRITTTGLTPDTAGNLSVGTAAIPFGAVVANIVKLPPILFANRPGTPEAGMMVSFSDSTTQTWGATITGGGALFAVGVYNGTAWTVFGK